MSEPLDELLDGALRTYVEQPRRGLEGRVLARVRRGGVGWWGVPGVAIVLAMFVVIVRLPEPVPVRTPEAKSAVANAHATKPAVVAAVRATKPARKRPGLPKKDAFPMSWPLSEGERALLALSQEHPDAVIGLAVDLNAKLEPLEIAPLEIVPIHREEGEKQP